MAQDGTQHVQTYPPIGGLPEIAKVTCTLCGNVWYWTREFYGDHWPTCACQENKQGPPR